MTVEEVKKIIDEESLKGGNLKLSPLSRTF